MPPKVKVTKENVVQAAMEIVRQSGAQAINARTVAAALHCSTQPIFSNFASMEELRYAVIGQADALCNEYMRREIESGQYPAYKASGMAYIRFAKEERELFQLLYMRDRAEEAVAVTFDAEMEDMVQRQTGLSIEEVRLFHMEMWAYVHGIATMMATGFVDLEWDLVSRMLTDAYQGLRKQFGLE